LKVYIVPMVRSDLALGCFMLLLFFHLIEVIVVTDISFSAHTLCSHGCKIH